MSERDSTRSVTVYGLCSSEDGKIRYVGQTIGLISARLRQHLHSPKRSKSAVAKWIKREIERGNTIRIFQIETNCVLHDTEKRLIAFYKRIGARLLNLTDGGEGTIGWRGNAGNKRPDLAERNRLASGIPGRPSSPETNAKISAANKGKKKPWLAERNKLGLGRPGHPHTDESKAKIGAANAGRKHSEESRKKMSEKAQGRK